MTDNFDTLHPRDGSSKRFVEKQNSHAETALPLPPTDNGFDFPETNRKLRGHRFYPKSITSWPTMYSTEETPLADKELHAHYFVGGCDWYIAEADTDTGIAFGYADLGFGGGEFGEIYLPELEAVVTRNGFPQVVERDLDFEAGTKVRAVLPQYANNT